MFFDSKTAFFKEDSFTSSDVKELMEFSAPTLIKLKELGLFSIFNNFHEFKQLSIYKELKELSNFKSLEDLSSTSFFTTYNTHSKLLEYKALKDFYMLKEVEGFKEF